MKTLPLLAAPLLLVGCGAAVPAASHTVVQTVTAPAPVNPTTNRPTDDENFLMLLRSQGLYYPGEDSTMIDLGHSICQALDQGNTVQDIMSLGLGSGLTQDQAATIVAASIVAYCPWNDPSA